MNSDKFSCFSGRSSSGKHLFKTKKVRPALAIQARWKMSIESQPLSLASVAPNRIALRIQKEIKVEMYKPAKIYTLYRSKYILYRTFIA